MKNLPNLNKQAASINIFYGYFIDNIADQYSYISPVIFSSLLLMLSDIPSTSSLSSLHHRDNWSYNDLTNFVLDPSCLHAVAGGSDGAHRVALSLMQVSASKTSEPTSRC